MMVSSHLLVTGTPPNQCSWQSNPKEAWQQGVSREVGCLLILQNADDNTSPKGASKWPSRKDFTWSPAKRGEVPRTSFFFSGITARHLLDILHLKFCVQEALWSSSRSVLLPRYPGSPLSWPLHRRLLGNTHRFLQKLSLSRSSQTNTQGMPWPISTRRRFQVFKSWLFQLYFANQVSTVALTTPVPKQS